jgi:hypothetical protein
VLTLLSGTKGFVVYNDEYKKTLGYVLRQHRKVIAYASRQLSCSWFGVSCSGVYITSVKILLVWISSSDLYGSQEFEVFDDTKRIKLYNIGDK